MRLRTVLLFALLPIQTSLAFSRSEPGSRQALLDSAKVLEGQKEFQSAIRIYDRILKKTPGDIEIKTLMARDLGWEGEYDSSLSVYRQVISVKTDYFDALIGYATVLAWSGDYSASLRALKELDTSHPGKYEVQLLLARVSLWAGESGDAVRYARSCLAIDSTSTDALVILSQAYANQLDLSSARDFARRAVDADPGNITARKLLISLENDYVNRAGIDFYDENLGPENRYSNRLVTLSFVRRVSYRLRLSAELESRRVFGSEDVAGGISGSYGISEKVIIGGSFLYGPGSSTAQRERAGIEITYAGPGLMSLSAGFQYLQFKGNSVRIFSPAASYYFPGETELTIKGFIGQTTSGGSSASILARLRKSFTDRIALSIGATHGAELYRLVSESFLTVTATGGSIGFEYDLPGGYAVELNTEYISRESSPWKYSYRGAINLSYRW